MLLNENSALRMNDLLHQFLFSGERNPTWSNFYLLSAITKNWLKSGQEPADHVAVTSLSLLKAIETRQTKRGMIEGIGADFGSGGGIQAIALLRMNPSLEHIYGVEIDPSSMNLSHFNAMLNDVEDRFSVVDNTDSTLDGKKDALLDALNGRKISIAVTNPRSI